MLERNQERMAAVPRNCEQKRWLRAAALAFGLTAVWSADALAQDPTLTLGRISRYRGDAPDATYDYRNTRPWWISYADCIHDDVFVFPLTVTNPSNRLEVWAGNDNCIERRGNTDRGQCWLVASQDRITRNPTIEVPVRNIVKRDTSALDVPSGLDETVCNGSTDADGNQLDLYFLIEDGGKAKGPGLKWSGASQGTGFDLVGPEPPTSVRVGIGENALILDIRGVSEDQELERFGAYCVAGTDPPGVFEDPDTLAVDAGTTPSTEAPEGTAAPDECFTAALRGGGPAPVDDALACGTASKSSGSIRTKRLDNDVTYAIAVAGQDILGNAGKLSNPIQCGTPRPLDSFYELYSDAGGKGGGGFCSVSPGRSGSAPTALLLLGISLAALHGRRARRNA
jgi:hypothetical protein